MMNTKRKRSKKLKKGIKTILIRQKWNRKKSSSLSTRKKGTTILISINNLPMHWRTSNRRKEGKHKGKRTTKTEQIIRTDLKLLEINKLKTDSTKTPDNQVQQQDIPEHQTNKNNTVEIPAPVSQIPYNNNASKKDQEKTNMILKTTGRGFQRGEFDSCSATTRHMHSNHQNKKQEQQQGMKQPEKSQKNLPNVDTGQVQDNSDLQSMSKEGVEVSDKQGQQLSREKTDQRKGTNTPLQNAKSKGVQKDNTDQQQQGGSDTLMKPPTINPEVN
ncbi:hypothetical protein KY285_000964 [Solanum tuberosum]|nr:hypothetical protein KY285_000964 [Solanum tuberosum]